VAALDPIAGQLLDALRERFSQRWRLDLAGAELLMRPRRVVHGKPQRQVPSPAALIDAMQTVLAGHGVPRPSLLPIRWDRDTDLLISAIQGLDPWLKDGADRVWREGFLPQPVVRFTGERGRDGRLRDGFLTSFVNLSCVQRVPDVERHVELLDAWIEGLSAVGIHAGRLHIAGSLAVWERQTVRGLTLHIECDGTGFADAVLLRNASEPSRMATDLGSGLERLRWLLSPTTWAETVFGGEAQRFDVDMLDAVRTATLLVMAGIRPSARGAGGALRRVALRIPEEMAASGLGRLVRVQRRYWTEVGMAGGPWPQVSEVIEATALTMSTRPVTGS
jgi:hypothetical protein